MLVSKKGTYLAKVKSVAIEQKDTGTVSATVAFDCEKLILAGDQTESVSGEGITGYFNLVTKEGKLNEINIRSLRESLGWDGASFSSLQDGTYDDVTVQIVVDDDTYNGKTQLKVKYLNPKDYTGPGAKKADTVTIKSLDSKFGSMLRAMGGSMPASAAAKKATANPTGVGNNVSLGRDMAWKAFTKHVDEYNSTNKGGDVYDEESRKETFRNIVTELASPKKPSELTPPEWAELTKRIEQDFSPGLREMIPFGL